jgi:hypothetical protein
VRFKRGGGLSRVLNANGVSKRFTFFPREISSFFLAKMRIPWKNEVTKLALKGYIMPLLPAAMSSIRPSIQGLVRLGVD